MARIAHERGVFVVALKSGRTEAGQRAARSHTGALANDDRLVDAALERLGIWRARTWPRLVAAAALYLNAMETEGAPPGRHLRIGRDLRDGGGRGDLVRPRDRQPQD